MMLTDDSAIEAALDTMPRPQPAPPPRSFLGDALAAVPGAQTLGEEIQQPSIARDDLSANFEAGFHRARVLDNSDADSFARAQAYEPIVEAINRDRPPGDRVINPYSWSPLATLKDTALGAFGVQGARDRAKDLIWARLADLRKTNPGLAGNLPQNEAELDADILAEQQTSAGYADLLAKNSGMAGKVAQFAGATVGGFIDPLNLAATAIGFPEASVAKSAAAAMLRTFLREGAINASLDLAGLPGRMGRYQAIGRPYTAGEAAAEVAGSFVLGGAIPAGVRGTVHVMQPKLPTEVEYREAAKRVFNRLQAGDGSDGSAARGQATVQLGHVIPELRAADLTIGPETSGLPSATPRFADAVPVFNREDLELSIEQAVLQRARARLVAEHAALPEGDAAAAERLSRLQAVEQQLADPAIDAADRRVFQNRRDEILTDTTPEALSAAAAPFEQRRTAVAQIASIDEQLARVNSRRAEIALAMRTPAEELHGLSGRALLDRFDADIPDPPPTARTARILVEDGEHLAATNPYGSDAASLSRHRTNLLESMRALDAGRGDLVPDDPVTPHSAPDNAKVAGPDVILAAGSPAEAGGQPRRPSGPERNIGTLSPEVQSLLARFGEPAVKPEAFRQQSRDLARELAPPRNDIVSEKVPPQENAKPEFGAAQGEIDVLRAMDQARAIPEIPELGLHGEKHTLKDATAEVVRQARAVERLRGCIEGEG